MNGAVKMKKWNKIRTGVLFLTCACLISASACSSQTAASASSSSSSSQSGGTVSKAVSSADGNSFYGKVTAVQGATITLAVGTMKQGNGRGGPEGAKPSGAASGVSSAGSRPERSQNSAGFNPLTLTGETKTITISDASVLSKQQMGMKRGRQEASSGAASSSQGQLEASASLSEIQKGTILKVTYRSDGKTLASVVMMGGAQGKN